MRQAPPALEYRGLQVAYGAILALRGIDLSVPQGALFAILGPNGAGKSTLAEATVGLLPATAGQIFLSGADITRLSSAERIARGVALVVEGRQLFTRLTVEDNLRLGARWRDTEHRMTRVYTLFPVLASRRTQIAGTMSGGEQQMLAIGRALMSEPSVLILDEPSSGLAPAIIDVLLEQLREISAHGTTVVLIEQNVRAAMSVATDVAVLSAGECVALGTPAQLGTEDTIAALYFGAADLG